MASGPDRARTWAWPGIWLRLVGMAAARRAVPVWAGVAIGAGMVFGGTGMRAADATGLARHEPLVGATLALLWLVLVAPVGAAMRAAAPGWLRALPGARGWRWLVVGGVALAVQGPWAALWLGGEGPAGAIAILPMAIAMLIVGGMRWPMRRRAPRWRTGVGALAAVHLRAMVRTRGAALARAAAWAMLAGAMAGLIARANALDDGGLGAALAAIALAVPLGIAGLVAPVVESDRAAGWIAPVGGAARIAAQGGALAAVGTGMGGAAALTAVALGGAPLALALGPVLGAGLGGFGVRAGAWAAAAPEFDGTRVVVALVGVAGLTAVAVGAIGAIAPMLVAALAVATGLRMAPR